MDEIAKIVDAGFGMRILEVTSDRDFLMLQAVSSRVRELRRQRDRYLAIEIRNQIAELF